MDQLRIPRAHVVGWSNGGATALHIADLAPERLASITLMASVGAQETEGSGDYYFEHAKYAFGIGLLGSLDVIPHFGLLGNRGNRLGWLWNFWDTDQRPLRGIMKTLTVPTLILHGRHDFLVRDWAAERHHELIPTSRLVMLDAGHLFPFYNPVIAVEHLSEHFERHDTPGVEPRTDYLNKAARPEHSGWRGWLEDQLTSYRAWHWAIQLLPVAPLAFWRRDLATAFVGWVVASGFLDFGVATLGLWIGAGVRQRRSMTLLRLVALFFTTILTLALARYLGSMLVSLGADHAGLVGFVIALGIVAFLLFALRHLFTRRRRQQLLARFGRLHHEFWPAWALYLPLVPWLIWLSVRHRGPRAFTCANPGIANGGGIVGESKTDIMRALGDGPEILLQRPITGDTQAERLASLRELQARHAELSYPVVLKPDAAQRGFGVAVARDERHVQDIFGRSPYPLVAQQYHPGPVEAGVLWTRNPDAPADGPAGSIFSVTRKAFPMLVGDGEHTIELLVMRHPRYRCQSRVFFERFRDRLGEVLDDGEELVLTNAGNHGQGCMFSDGADMVTPELEAAIDRIASGFRSDDDGELDFGRFDIRAGSEDEIRAGRFAVVEVNGTTSESTNIYDPDRSVFWAWSVLFRQWATLYRLGAWRRSQGVKPIGYATLFRALRENRRASKARAISD